MGSERDILNQLGNEKRIILYGCGFAGKLLFKRLEDIGINVSRVTFMTGREAEKGTYREIRIVMVGEIPVKDAIFIIATTEDKHFEIEKRIRECYGDNVQYSRLTESIIREMVNNHKEALANKASEYRTDLVYMSSDNYSASGAFLCMIDLNVELNRLGISTLIILPLGSPVHSDGEDLLIKNNLRYMIIDSAYWFTKDRKQKELPNNEEAIEKIEEIIRSSHAKLVYQNTIYTYVGAIAAGRCGVPYIWHIRENIYREDWRFCDEAFSRNLINAASRVIAVSDYIRDSYVWLDQTKTIVVHDGVDAGRFSRIKRGVPDDVLRIVCVGVVRKLKGQIDLVRAAAILKENGIRFDIKFIGTVGETVEEEHYYRKLKGMIKDLGLDEEIRFLGCVENIEEYYCDADISVVCSRSEAFGRVTAESLLSGIYVIGADNSATIELIKMAQSGTFYETGNSCDLANKIMTVCKNGLRGNVLKPGMFSREENARKIKEVIDEVIYE